MSLMKKILLNILYKSFLHKSRISVRKRLAFRVESISFGYIKIEEGS